MTKQEISSILYRYFGKTVENKTTTKKGILVEKFNEAFLKNPGLLSVDRATAYERVESELVEGDDSGDDDGNVIPYGVDPHAGS